MAGGLIGALTGWGFSEAEAKAYQDGIERAGGDRVSTGTVNRR